MGAGGILLALLLLAGWAHAETVRILAIRVDFQPDTLTTTTGDGTFGSAFRFAEPWAVDPLPHDSLYFDSHLRFLGFYWNEVSGGAVDLEWEIWPRGAEAAYRLPKPMWEYHWNESDERTDEQLAALFRDSWTVADQDPHLRVFDEAGQPRFDAFIVFHAGVGQDFGDDSTPHDIPSAFLAPDPISGAAPHEIRMRDVPGGPELPLRQGLLLPEGENHADYEHGMAGLLVWHVDERSANAGHVASNSVNNDPARRGSPRAPCPRRLPGLADAPNPARFGSRHRGGRAAGHGSWRCPGPSAPICR